MNELNHNNVRGLASRLPSSVPPIEKESSDIKNASRAEQLWDLFVSSRARSGEIPLVIAARIFNRPINQLSPKEMNDLLHDSKDGMIGCHWIYATVSQQN
ncbi:hypothetical protein ANCCEY_03042 [Ancylostoma ceylanicum]|uniref:Uncharacterized protein n=1 Tax=Ancylostoma ceylanicum TaxID=53326 RepID=A0A0D6M632_9BILA|nr:hypothetical protein ANCCEY_03042 [Ancylostoma ceylanicum]